MQIRESGMPEENYWETLMDVDGIMEAFCINSSVGNVVELGCGYGTFTIPVAQRISGTIFSCDIDSDMVARTNSRALDMGVANLKCELRDVLENGFAVPDSEPVAVCMLFNILHVKNPTTLLSQAASVVNPGGKVLVIHWRFDSETPRGPSMEIRPRPEQIIAWAHQTGELQLQGGVIDLPPWHFGMQFSRNGLRL